MAPAYRPFDLPGRPFAPDQRLKGVLTFDPLTHFHLSHPLRIPKVRNSMHHTVSEAYHKRMALEIFGDLVRGPLRAGQNKKELPLQCQ